MFLKSAAAARGRAAASTRRSRGRPSSTAAACSARGRPIIEPKAKNLIVIFLTGGFSHVDTFDYKPTLSRYHGKSVPSFGLRPDETHDRPLMGSPFRFRACGESGLMISELFPHLGPMADELCVIRTLHTDIVEHFQAVLAMHTGSATVPMPSLGAWISYGLGTFNPNLPSYVVLCEHLPYAGTQVWDSSFLPPIHQGVRIVPGPEPIPDLRPPGAAGDAARAGADHAPRRQRAPRRARRPDDADLRARIATLRRRPRHDARGARGPRRRSRVAGHARALRRSPTATRRRSATSA